MCGIAGQYNFSSQKPVDRVLVKRMTDALDHRGPDAEGHFIRGNVGLGFRRLAIIDLSPAGNQPMTNEGGTVHIVFNGEIYNFQDLRPDLERKGHVFRSHTDTETILHLYEEEGVACLQKLRGMFAFAIWDEKKQRLFIARDRLGKKPLKYHISKHGITFASELKALLRDPEIPREVDERAIHHYLTLQYVPSPMTGFVGIQKLPPAHYVLVEKGKVTIERYWSLLFATKRSMSHEEWKEQVLQKLEESVKLRMIADVPLGAFLSGGVDSGTIVALMAKNSAQPVKTFSIGFKEASHNELPLAKLVAERYATQHTEFIVEPKAADIMPLLAYHYEEPYADSSALPTYYVSKLTRQHVTVALNGDGGDENFGGYPWYAAQKVAAMIGWQPFSGIANGIGLLFEKAGFAQRSVFWRRALLFARTLHLAAPERYASYFTSSYFSEQEKLQLYTSEFRSRMQGESAPERIAAVYRNTDAVTPLDQALATDIATYLPDDLLVKVDIASMATSLEARSPFLDHEFMELVASMPSNMKMPGLSLKPFLKDAVVDRIPPEIIHGKKHGFAIPIDRWFRADLYERAKEIVLPHDAEIHKYIQHEKIEALLRQHAAGRMNHGSRIWALCMLELWMQRFIKGDQRHVQA